MASSFKNFKDFKKLIWYYAQGGIKVVLAYSFKEDVLTTFIHPLASKTNYACWIKNVIILDFSSCGDLTSYEIVLLDKNFSEVKRNLYMTLKEAEEKFLEYIASPREWRYKT